MTMTNDIRQIIRIVHCGFYRNIHYSNKGFRKLYIIHNCGQCFIFVSESFKKKLEIQFFTHQEVLKYFPNS